MDIYSRLYYDICEALYPSVQCNFWNQDCGMVKICTKDYVATFNFTNQEESEMLKQLAMVSFHNGTGSNLYDFLKKVKYSNLSIPIYDNGLIERDISKDIFDVSKIIISDSMIDNFCIEVIKKYFPHVKEIEFNHCQMDSNCFFKNVHTCLSFKDSVIENIRSFHQCEADLSFLRVKINKISPMMFLSRKIEIKSICKQQDINVYELFLKCHFKELKQLQISKQDISDSFENGFFYLSYAAPKLEEVTIGGKVKSLEFLTKFKYLREISVHAIEDELGLGTAVVTDYHEREKIIERNKKAYQIRKILNSNEEYQYLIGELEIERILKLCHFRSFLNITKENGLNTLDEQIPLSLSMEVGNVVKTYYEYEDGILFFKKAPRNLDAYFNRKSQYRIFNNILYEYQEGQQNKIVRAKDFIYRQDGTPILFHHRKKQISPNGDIIHFMKEKTIVNSDNKSCLKFLKEYQEEDMPMECFIDMMEEVLQLDITELPNLLKDLEGAEELKKVFFQYYRFRQIKREIKEKQNGCRESLMNLIEENYSFFTFQEKVYLYTHHMDNVIESNPSLTEKIHKEFDKWVEEEEEVLEGIHQKTNGLYSKYQQYMKLTNKSYDSKTPDIEVKKSYIKKIKW